MTEYKTTTWQVYEIETDKTEREFDTEAQAEDYRFDIDDDGGVFDVRMCTTPLLKDRIIGMMTENTGINMLDSGGANGRGWQRNQLIDDWDATPVVSLDVWEDEVIVSYSVYHYLMNFLSITNKSERLNNTMRDIMNESDDPIYADIIEFFSWQGIPEHNVINTYNYDNILGGVLQYTLFKIGDESYIMLQVHNGADVRGGYTVPQIFSLGNDEDMTHFVIAQDDINARCECSDWLSDDAGANYYLDGSSPSPDRDWVYDADNDRVTCAKCGKEVVFSVTEGW